MDQYKIASAVYDEWGGWMPTLVFSPIGRSASKDLADAFNTSVLIVDCEKGIVFHGRDELITNTSNDVLLVTEGKLSDEKMEKLWTILREGGAQDLFIANVVLNTEDSTIIESMDVVPDPDNIESPSMAVTGTTPSGAGALGAAPNL